MRYQAAIEHLYARGYELAPRPDEISRREFDLNHMRMLAGALGNPQLRFPSILIAGTNGKGSTAATLASILHASGYKTGLYTSPHLSRVNERWHPKFQAIASAPSVMMPSPASTQVDDAAIELVREGALPTHPHSLRS
jgi:dihydrofolate synthase/folylpolyglutamate synthase